MDKKTDPRTKIRLQNKASMDRRRIALDTFAKAAGYPNFDRFATLVKRGVVQLPPCPKEVTE